VLPTLRVTCVSVGSPCVYMIPSSTFSTCFVLSGKCFANGVTVIRASHMGNYMLHAQVLETLQMFTFWLPKGKQRTSVTFQTDGNIPVSLHIFAFLLIVEQDIVLIYNAAFFFLCVCFCVSSGPFHA
jgi:hypothetical protein